MKAAVIGAGAFGRHHATKYRGIEGVELVAIADPSPEVRRNAPTTHGVRGVADWRELLGEVDLVSVCSPATTHSTIVRAFLNAGANVMVEKPIATSVEEADDLVTLAAKTGKVLTVGHQERFVFAHTGLLDYNEVPLEVSCWRKGPWTGRGADVSVVLDLMIHDLDLVHQLIPGKVRSVQARGRCEKSLLADDVQAAVMFENGAVARLETSRVAPERSRGMKAVYADGIVEIDFLTRSVTNTTPRALNALDVGDPLGESVTSFVESVRTGTSPLVRPEEARNALATAILVDEAWERSIRSRVRRDVVAVAAAN
ncbi:Gfo/Idh/MocA family protein [Rhizomicrobium electricum]|uniref:Gfo/Idh/MocA family protein n=1 Tax=Rhizomicrobium electricum TaxID=480070 RepID=UPI0014239D30|nr:Gfo/Idh/MocA family oxidoreductase [Rhizomicrobium electricum]NIJ50491.1 putative dehydrogenase [Rhizomicrobium electricum]